MDFFMKWDDNKKKKLQELITTKLDEIIKPLFPAGGLGAIAHKNPNMTINDIAAQFAPNFKARDAMVAQFFAEYGMECGPLIIDGENRVTLDTVGMGGGLKGPLISIPNEVAEKFLVFGIP